jgi:hypothetical protein
MRAATFFWCVWIACLVFHVSVLGEATLGDAAKQHDATISQGPSSSPATRPEVSTVQPKTVPRSEYVSDSVCAQCHRDRFATYEKTAHHFTSQLPTKSTLTGTFAPGNNIMATSNPNLSFQMKETNGGFFETAIWGTPDDPAARTRTERIGLVIGSGGKGQTYLYWNEDQLFQLPVGYSTVLHRWINSVGYEDGVADFKRPIIPRCLECHASYAQPAFPDPEVNLYDTKSFELGISCNRCHGPERRHVARYKSANATTMPDDIVNPAKLPAARQMEVCTQCHAGPGRELLPAFSYVPGEPLDKYIDFGPRDPTQDIDVHGKQGMLLVKSKCYQSSGDLQCSTCHDVHQKRPGLDAMSQHCLSCHKVEQSPTHAKVGEGITQNCIDCHMPRLSSKVIYFNVDGHRVPFKMRSHWIRVYSPDELQ